MKAKVLLYEHVGLSLIVESPSGVVYSNQAGGHACLQPEMEGFLIPLRNDHSLGDNRLVSPATALEDHFAGEKWRGAGATGGIDAEDADFIDKLLERHRLSHCLEVDRMRLGESFEAWIHVKLTADEDTSLALFSNLGPYPRAAVMTWENSD